MPPSISQLLQPHISTKSLRSAGQWRPRCAGSLLLSFIHLYYFKCFLCFEKHCGNSALVKWFINKLYLFSAQTKSLCESQRRTSTLGGAHLCVTLQSKSIIITSCLFRNILSKLKQRRRFSIVSGLTKVTRLETRVLSLPARSTHTWIPSRNILLHAYSLSHASHLLHARGKSLRILSLAPCSPPPCAIIKQLPTHHACFS